MSFGHSHSHSDGHGHSHGNGHGNGHGHGHSHAPADFGRAFALSVILNTIFVAIEAVYGWLSGSMALLADAGHNLSDVLSLLLAWGASVLAKRTPTERFTYGFKNSTILAALANATLLLVAVGMILIETIRRFSDPQPVEAGTVMLVAGVGIVVNTATALLFLRGRKHDINIRGAFLHMAADALVSLGVVIAGALIWWTGMLWIDPVTSLVIVAVIAWSTWGLLKDSIRMSLLGVPENISEAEVRSCLSGLRGVEDVHHVHIWPMSTTETAMTAHLVMPRGHPGDAFLHEASDILSREFHIGHVTLQVEIGHQECEADC